MTQSPSAPIGTDDTLDRLRAHGEDAVSFQSLESGALTWRDEALPSGTDAVVAYVDTGRSWIAVGSPLVDRTHRAQAVTRFVSAARAAHRRAIFFGVEDATPFATLQRLQLGEQSVLLTSEWSATLRAIPKLRAQVRRARAKGVTTRVVAPQELEPGTPLRAAVDGLRAQWLALRPIEPMGFLVAVEPFHAPHEHVYVVAERQGVAVQFLSAVPIYGSSGWLMEDMLRGPSAPNGTTELIINTLMEEVADRAVWITPGLTPLSGAVPSWLRWASVVTRPLYDFEGLRRFRARLHPARWNPVWLIWDRGPAPLVLVDVLRAFAKGRLVAFGWRSLTRHPNGPPWAVGVPLVAWTMCLVVIAASGHATLMGFSLRQLTGWIVFDAVLAWGFFHVARRPRTRGLAWLTAAAASDLVQSIWHLANVGAGPTVLSAILRVLAVAGPVVGTAAMAWSVILSRHDRR